jgi:hypothetical protein
MFVSLAYSRDGREVASDAKMSLPYPPPDA